MTDTNTKHQINDVDTDAGNALLESLLKDGWKVKSEYSADLIDKGIDFDSYEIRFESSFLNFEWDNWMEWKIEGDKESIAEITCRLTTIEQSTKTAQVQERSATKVSQAPSPRDPT